ncbi:MAG: bifunctional pyr operon transcriptional regulator/uracil phosphoribosyltransferase PyrR [Candidatus Sumerlaeota bacterium]|nr:bifunctional pyr operon transcriptional regulator/uracil phosphoribosyltransferase PyrR [Candidatus Sumerlaeota bacterium]
MSEPRELMNKEQMDKAIAELAERIDRDVAEPGATALVGIRTRGVPLASRLRKIYALTREWNLPLGHLDITLYRDDLSTLGSQPMVRESRIEFPVDGKTIILVDDVLYTGRTVRSAIDAILDFGRPRAIRLAVLVDRGLREYPIQPDYCALKIETRPNQTVQVLFPQVDGRQQVLLLTLDEGEAPEPA